MALKIDNPTTYRFNDDITTFFDVEIDDPIRDNDYELLKKEIYKLDIDSEEKANIINSINKLNINISKFKTYEFNLEDFKVMENIDDVAKLTEMATTLDSSEQRATVEAIAQNKDELLSTLRGDLFRTINKEVGNISVKNRTCSSVNSSGTLTGPTFACGTRIYSACPP
mgnify:CR=1 FL=1